MQSEFLISCLVPRFSLAYTSERGMGLRLTAPERMNDPAWWIKLLQRTPQQVRHLGWYEIDGKAGQSSIGRRRELRKHAHIGQVRKL